MRILFVRTDRMGDVLMNLPALRLLRQTFPKAWIALLLDRKLSGLLDGHPDIDEILFVRAEDLKRRFLARISLARQIRKIGFDLAIASNPDKWIHAVLFAAGVPERAGYRRKWGFFLTRTIADGKASGARHQIDVNLDLVRLVGGGSWDGKLFIPISPDAKQSVERRLAGENLAGQPFVVVHPGTSNPEKRWSADGFAAVCRMLWERRALKTILIGGEEEKEPSRRVLENTGEASADWTDSLSLGELVALLGHEKTKALVSCDSGPVHIAWMNGTAAVALYARDCCDPARWGPRDSRSRVIFKAIGQISPEEVYRSLEEALDA
ncbi:MAG: glycosyltransferase family 9 protein [Candidatus Omnitrophica bacterium]|nr:glycosyltransferase family 9 protein [Candidatus Omnitrophota bacterium]